MGHGMIPGHAGLQPNAAECLLMWKWLHHRRVVRMLCTVFHQDLKSRRGMDHSAVSCGACYTRALELPQKPVVRMESTEVKVSKRQVSVLAQ